MLNADKIKCGTVIDLLRSLRAENRPAIQEIKMPAVEAVLQCISEISGDNQELALSVNAHYSMSTRISVDQMHGIGGYNIKSASEAKYGWSSTVTYWQVREFPGNPQCVILGDAYVSHGYRDKGINTLCREFRLLQAYCLGYKTAIMTNVGKLQSDRNFSKYGWEIVHTFKNPRTSNVVTMWAHNLCSPK